MATDQPWRPSCWTSMTLLCWPATTPSPHPCLGWRQGNQRFEELSAQPEALRGALGTQPQPSQEPADGLDGFTLKKAECAAGGPGTAESAPLMPGATPTPAPATSTSPELEPVQARLERLEGLLLRIAKQLGVGSRDALLGVAVSGTDEP